MNKIKENNIKETKNVKNIYKCKVNLRKQIYI